MVAKNDPPVAEKKISPSAYFRSCAEVLTAGLSHVLTKRDERDAAAIRVGQAKGELLAAEAELEVRQRSLDETKAMIAPQSDFALGMMEDEAKENIAALRVVGE